MTLLWNLELKEQTNLTTLRQISNAEKKCSIMKPQNVVSSQVSFFLRNQAIGQSQRYITGRKSVDLPRYWSMECGRRGKDLRWKWSFLGKVNRGWAMEEEDPMPRNGAWITAISYYPQIQFVRLSDRQYHPKKRCISAIFYSIKLIIS